MKALVFVAALSLVVCCATFLYILVRHFHRQWYWQDKVNENNIRRNLMDELDIQYEVDEKGFVRPVSRKDRGHRPRGSVVT